MARKATQQPKKRPRQQRSRATVDFILQAAANILNSDGGPRLSTNRIAAQAGVAIASLYQYFPNKESIVNALFEQELQEERAELDQQSSKLRDRPAKEIIHLGVQSTIDVHAKRPKLVKSILESIPGGTEALTRARQQVIDLVAQAMRERQAELRAPRRFEIKAFLVVHAIESAIHAAAQERPELLTDPAFAEELKELIDRFLLPES